MSQAHKMRSDYEDATRTHTHTQQPIWFVSKFQQELSMHSRNSCGIEAAAAAAAAEKRTKDNF